MCSQSFNLSAKASNPARSHGLRWLKTVSSTKILMGCYSHSSSLAATIMVSKNCSTIGEHVVVLLGCVRLGYSGIGIYSGIYSGSSALGSRIAGMEIQIFRNENSSQTNAYSHYSTYSYSGLIPNERALNNLIGYHSNSMTC